MGCFVIAGFGSGSHVKRCDMCRSDAFEAAIVVSRSQKLKAINIYIYIYIHVYSASLSLSLSVYVLPPPNYTIMTMSLLGRPARGVWEAIWVGSHLIFSVEP